VRVLFVCEANRSRSPVAAALWTREMERLGVLTTVWSAGVHALPDQHASHQTSWAAARHGIDLAAHRSRPLSETIVSGADLILTMTRDQSDHVGMNHRRVSDRMFLVSELAALLRMGEGDVALPAAATLPPSGSGAGSGVVTAERLSRIIAVAHTRRLMRGIQDDDVVEPGEDPAAVEAVIGRLSTDITTIVEHLALK
jgi:protein-tyrosine phosphatase